MNFGDLYHANFSLLDESIDDWNSTVSKLKTLEEDARTGMRQKAEKANWSGVNARVGKDFVRSTAREFADAVKEAESIRNIIRDTRDDLNSRRSELRQLVEEAGRYELLVQELDGGGYQVAHRTTRGPVDQETRSARQGKAEEISNAIQDVLRAANEIDASASSSLTLLMDQAKYGFSDAKYKDRDSAAEAMKDAERAATLARVKNPSDEQLQQLNRYLAAHKNDDLFADRFASKLGATETLQFWANVTSEHGNAQGEDLKRLQQLQENLRVTLANATTSDSAGMANWKRDVIQSGAQIFQPTGLSPVDPSGPYGYQIMGSLLGKGRYDTEFLVDFSRSVTRFENPGESSAEIWRSGPGSSSDLVFGRGDGRDPMAGVLHALSNNYEASEQVFSSKSDLSHILDTAQNSEERALHAGHALHAAVTGMDYTTGVVLPGVPHSEQQVAIMKEVMGYYASPDHSADGDGLAEAAKPPMAKSLGNMAASYMAEINRVMAGEGSENLYPTSGGDPSSIAKEDTVRFLSHLAQNKDSNAAVLMGSSIYTAGMLEMHISDPKLYSGDADSAIGHIAQNTGIIEGILAHSRADMEIAEGKSYDEEYNESLKQRGELMKAVINTGAALGPELVLGNNAGASVAGTTGLGLIGGMAGIVVDQYVTDHSQDNADKHIYGASHELNQSEVDGKHQFRLMVERSAAEHDYEISPGKLNTFLKDDYSGGWVDSDTILEDSRKRSSA